MIATESASLVLRPNIIVPRQSWLTLTPVRPRLRYSTIAISSEAPADDLSGRR